MFEACKLDAAESKKKKKKSVHPSHYLFHAQKMRLQIKIVSRLFCVSERIIQKCFIPQIIDFR